ncbi:LytTR family DNA-binding domain-containing protein [Massilia sp. IC2-476]|uniref:LytTR family DNA-binding domain-containing protein n=1 Tax=Massilia sp. IC2-476 TaxID=2887199 RepID=UPI001D11C490|nr:LytTR family DNA-binding domain-containing protein [Massilia sp. IC2-476]MCC2973422.1 LytTR family transcriptional regulator [Massilia sp. IC2-476]
MNPPLLTQLASVFGLALCLAVLGPFGTYTDLSVPVRYAYWIGLVLVGYLNILLAAHAVASLRPGLRHRWTLMVVTLVSSVPTTLAVAWVESVTRLAHSVPLSVFPRVYGCVALIQLVMLLFLTRLQPSLSALLLRREQADSPAPVAVPEATPAFYRRIPPHLGQELLALSAEDHYLRIITAAGSDLILMRFADALVELGDSAGLQVHRSWWVAHGAVRSLGRDKGRLSLTLHNGLEVPVSRTYVAAVRATGVSA